MSQTSGPSGLRLPAAARTGGYLAIQRGRGPPMAPSASGIARRRWMMSASKILMPAAALLLLASIAIWPELDRATDKARVAMHGMGGSVEGARLANAHYHGVDERGRPFTVTAGSASQKDVDRVDFVMPNADMTLENGSWINVTSRQGVFERKAQLLDLSGDVVLYRDDGTTLRTEAATVAVKEGAASGAEPTHVEGPFGTIDATGFTTLEKGAVIQFWGPAQVMLNGAGK